jgi:membrane-associated phospholipid phosphatase
MKTSFPITNAAILILVSFFADRPAFCQESASTPYELRLKVDLPVFVAAGAGALTPVFLTDRVNKTCPCAVSGVNGFDRGAAGRRSDSLDKVSTGAVVASVVWPAASILFDSETSRDALIDGLITGQAVLVNVAVNQVVKVSAQRPRPLVYGLAAGDPLIQKSDNYLSFYSQHTSVVFAAGISYARTFALRHPQSRYRWLIYSAAAGGGTAVAAMRVLSGRHFPTDVLMGAASGTGTGLLIPWLHRRRSTTSTLFIVPTRSGAMLSLRVPFG